MLHLIFPLLIALNSAKYTDWAKLRVNATESAYLDATAELHKELFQNRYYRKELSPVYSKQPSNLTQTSYPRFNVEIELAFIKLFEINAQSQTVTMGLEFMQFWVDPRLSWLPEEYDGIEVIWLGFDTVWIPEYSVFDVSAITEAWPDYRRPVRVQSTGLVYLDTQQVVTISCPMDLGKFPFDSQICPILFGLASYWVNQITSNGTLFDFDYKSMSGNGEWTVENISLTAYQVPSKTMPQDVLCFEMYVKREPNFYIYVIVLPTFLLTFLSVTGMFWTPNTKDEQLTKMSIGLTSMMSMTIFVQMVSEQIPRTVTFPLLGIFVIVCVAIVSCACVVLIMFSTKRKEKEQKTDK
ncbi:unnamed protein product, partial [Mesorhabditis spiculigera]